LPESIEVLDQSAFDRFRVDLADAGFERQSPPKSHVWVGPIPAFMSDVTSATSMEIEVRGGWPYVHPIVRVDGLEPGLHLQGSQVCLWFDWDYGLEWMRLAGLLARLEKWVDEYRAGMPDEPGLDPHMYFRDPMDGTPYGHEPLIVVDLDAMTMEDGGSGISRGKEIDGAFFVLGRGPLTLRWYARSSVSPPPHDWGAFLAALTDAQRRDLEERMNRAGKRGGLNLVMLVWQTPAGRNALAIALERKGGMVVKRALEVASVDMRSRILRSGPDANNLQTRTVAIIGVGAIGSQLADLLGRSGIGHLILADPQRLRPGDLIRHAATFQGVGVNKAQAMQRHLQTVAPRTEVIPIEDRVQQPALISMILGGAALIVDAVGEGVFTEMLSRLAEREHKALIAVALYRHGQIARVRVQMPGGPSPIHLRTPKAGYPLILPLADELAAPVWETGCVAPVNNAPPISVTLAAAEGAQAVADALLARRTTDQDIVHVVRPQADAPFTDIGVLHFP
jgi:ThiF family